MTNLPDVDELRNSYIIADIKRIFDASGVDNAALFTLKEYKDGGGVYDGRMMRSIGGFPSLLKAAVPEAFRTHRAFASHLKKNNTYIEKLESSELKYKYLRDATLEATQAALAGIEPALAQRSFKQSRSKPGPLKRMNVSLISDTHFGLDIDPYEALGNEYNWTIAAARFAQYIEQIASFKIEHRKDCDGVALLLGGDLGQGVVHWKTDSGTQLLAHQLVGISSYMIQAVEYLRQHFKKVDIYFTTDNHMRATYRHNERSTGQKWDSYSMPIATALEARFMDCPEVGVHFSKAPINTFKLLGHKYGLTHGDTHVSAGNVGKSINIESISKQLLKLNAAQTDGFYDVFCMGHVHTPLRIAVASSNTEVIVNGTMSGTDAYAAGEGFFKTLACQTLWECTDKHSVGDWRIVHLNDAPIDQKIIVPYTGDLHLYKSK
jgi:predicted phosphodiesterase